MGRKGSRWRWWGDLQIEGRESPLWVGFALLAIAMVFTFTSSAPLSAAAVFLYCPGGGCPAPLQGHPRVFTSLYFQLPPSCFYCIGVICIQSCSLFCNCYMFFYEKHFSIYIKQPYYKRSFEEGRITRRSLDQSNNNTETRARKNTPAVS
jgi:uncharacterized Zn-finger protein